MNSQLLAGIVRLSDEELLTHVAHLAQNEREATASLVAHLAEIDERNLHLARGFSSLIEYCVVVLHFSEGGASKRVRAARLARRTPALFEMLATGELNLATIGLLGTHLTSENQSELLAAARFQSRRQVEVLLADLRPLPDVPTTIRKLPEPRGGMPSNGNGAASTRSSDVPGLRMEATPADLGLTARDADLTARDADLPARDFDLAATAANPGLAVESTPASSPRPSMESARAIPPAVIAPLGAGRFRIQFTARRETYAKLLRAQELLRHAIPKGDAGAIIDRALTVLLVQLEKKKLAATDRPRPSQPAKPGSRHIPAAVLREVWARDEHRCTFTSPDGRRCTSTAFLEVDHVQPFAAGGETRLENLRLLCRAHNQHAAEVFFGPENVKRRIETTKQRARKRNGGSGGFLSRETSSTYGLESRPRPRAGDRTGWSASRGAG